MESKHSTRRYKVIRYSILLVTLGFLVFTQFYHDHFFIIEQDPWHQWSDHNEASVQTISHEPWQTILNNYVIDQPYGKKG